MTQEEEKYYENFFDLFATEGWKQFVEDLQIAFDSYNIESLETLEELHKAKGERAMLSRMLSFQLGVETSYTTIKEDGELE
jgi:hypothetical protein